MSGSAKIGSSIPGDRSGVRPAGQLVPIVGAVVTVVLLLFGFLAVLHELFGVDVRVLVRDPAEGADIPEYAGAYTYAGVLLLWTAGIVAVITGVLLRGDSAEPEARRFSIGLGAFLCWLAADDLFMIHEWLGLGLSRMIGIENEYLGRTRLEGVVFLAYGVVALAWMVRYRDVLVRREPVIFGLGVGCFALSAGVDIGGSVFDGMFEAGDVLKAIRAYAEDMLKFAGILFMLVYVVRAARATSQTMAAGIL